MNLDLAARSARATLEATLSLLGAIAVTLLFTLPFVTFDRITVPLIPDPAETPTGAASETLLDDLGRAAIAKSISVQLLDGRDQLVLDGVEDEGKATTEIAQALKRAGFMGAIPETRPSQNFDQLIEQEPRSLFVLLTIQSSVFLLVGWLLARRRVEHACLAIRTGRGGAILVGLIGGCLALAASQLVSTILGAVGLPVQEQDWVQQILSRPDLLQRLVPWMVLIGPLAEEVFFRGYIYRRLRAEAGLATGLLISASLFALTHFNASGFLVYLTIGIVLALSYERSGRLLTPIVGHVVINVGALMAGLLLPPSP